MVWLLSSSELEQLEKAAWFDEQGNPKQATMNV
jgi:hypothetical protein